MKNKFMMGLSTILVLIALAIYFNGGVFENGKDKLNSSSDSESVFTDINDTGSSKSVYVIAEESDYRAIHPKDLYKQADVVIIGNYVTDNSISVGEANKIITESSFNIKEVIKGGNLLNSYNNIDIEYYGGEVSIEDYVDHLDPDQIKKRGYDKLTEEEKRVSKIKYVPYKETLLTNREKDTTKDYMIFLSYDETNNKYFILSEGYGMREIKEDDMLFNPDTQTFEKTTIEYSPL